MISGEDTLDSFRDWADVVVETGVDEVLDQLEFVTWIECYAAYIVIKILTPLAGLVDSRDTFCKETNIKEFI